ncbi:MAG: hypothetical protein V1672_05240 [Candidatus Diapherotrites archaeon]
MADIPIGAKVSGWIFIISGVLGVLAGLLILFGGGLMGTLMMGAEESLAGGAFAAIFGVVGFIVIILSAIEIYVGRSILQLKKWARLGGTVLAALTLLGFPIGTVIGAVILYFLWMHKETKAAFDSAV